MPGYQGYKKKKSISHLFFRVPDRVGYIETKSTFFFNHFLIRLELSPFLFVMHVDLGDRLLLFLSCIWLLVLFLSFGSFCGTDQTFIMLGVTTLPTSPTHPLCSVLRLGLSVQDPRLLHLSLFFIAGCRSRFARAVFQCQCKTL